MSKPVEAARVIYRLRGRRSSVRLGLWLAAYDYGKRSIFAANRPYDDLVPNRNALMKLKQEMEVDSECSTH